MQRVQHARGWSFLPKVTFILTIGLITAATGFKASAVDVFTDAVGFMTEPVTNVSGGFNTFALPLQQLAADRGLVTAVGAGTLTVACPTCASANYGDPTALNYVQFETGAGIGRSYSIVTNDASGNITLNVGSDNLLTIGVASGDQYTIHPYWRIQDAFGTVATTSLHASNTAGRADNVLVWNGASFVTYFPNSTSGLWSPSGTDPLLPDESVLIVRKGAAVTNLVNIGLVRKTNLVTNLQLGFNLVGNSFPAATVVSNLNLIGSGSGFQGSNTAGRADNVLVWNGAAFDTLFFNTTSQLWSPSGAYPILPTSTYFINMKHQAGEWVRPLPY